MLPRLLLFAAYLKEEGLNWVIAEREKRGESGKPSRESYAKYAKAILVVGDERRAVAPDSVLTLRGFSRTRPPPAIRPPGA